MIELVLARHGQSYSNLDRSLGPDADLTELGHKQAGQLGKWLIEQGYAFTALYCSTLRRAQQTADIVNKHYGLNIIFDPDLREAEIQYLDKLPLRENPLDLEHPQFFAAEYEQLCERVTRVTTRILAENSEGQILVIAHGGTLGTMLRSILGTHALLVRTEQAAVHCLRWENGRWNLQYVNRQEHFLDESSKA